MPLDDLVARFQAAGAKPGHVGRILRRWAQATAPEQERVRDADVLPAAVRAVLPEVFADLERLAQVAAEHPGGDGARRLLVKLADGQTVESVLLPREGVCVSTQVGCAVGCAFCMTGTLGLLRQLDSVEIVAQVVLARRRQPIRKVVFMGMGEPAHNLDAVLDAIDVLGTHGAIGHKNLVFSTVGDRRIFARLPACRVKPALALSLHTTDADLRTRLLPRAPRLSPAELVARCGEYAKATGYPIQYQWTLLAGINDGDAEFDRLAEWLSGQYAVLNLIPFNAVDGSGYSRPTPARIDAIRERLYRRGVLTKVRHSAGQDVAGGCGQLRAALVVPSPRSRRRRDAAAG